MGVTAVEAFAIAASLATMSTGIALNVLKAGNVLNQPVGQLIIAAATVNEMCNIVLITLVGVVVKDMDPATPQTLSVWPWSRSWRSIR